MPLHPKAKVFAKSGLFAGVSSFAELEGRIAAIPESKGKGDAFEVASFAELEKRIAAIPENKGKGDAFEVFAEAYL